MKGLTLKASLRSAEMCDLAEHRSMELQGEVRIFETKGLGQSHNGEIASIFEIR